MIGNAKDLVIPNPEELNKDLKKYGLSATALCNKLGKSPTYVHDAFSKPRVMRKTIENIEDCMFREHGSYYFELEENKENFTSNSNSNRRDRSNTAAEIVEELSTNSSLWGAIDSTIAGSYCRTAKLAEKIESAIKETQFENKKLLEAILQKEKEICTLNARLLATWEVKNK